HRFPLRAYGQYHRCLQLNPDLCRYRHRRLIPGRASRAPGNAGIASLHVADGQNPLLTKAYAWRYDKCVKGAWRIRLVVQDAALSRRRSRVRLPYALPNTHFDPSQASREAAWDVSLFGDSPPVQQLYSNALSIILRYGIKNSSL